MKASSHPTLSAFASIVLLAIAPVASAQQVPILDAQGVTRDQPANGQASSGGNATGARADLIYELYSRLDQLQQEMQTLRGMVEEQSYQIRRMEQEQRDRYLDLDSRVSELTRGGGTTAPGPAGDRLYPPGMVPINQDIASELSSDTAVPDQSGTLAATEENEQQIYRTALNQLLEEGRYEESIRGFQRYIDNFPMGQYFTNALYWQGEALILVGRFDEALSAFNRVVNDYPDDPKAAGAMLKMGVAHRQIGQPERAREIWESISERYPDSLTEIRAADDYLSRLQAP